MEIKKLKAVRPLFTGVITTADKEEKTVSGIIMVNRNKSFTSNWQKVIAVGDMVKTVKVGDIVHINPIRYGKSKYKEGSLKDGVIEENFHVEFDIPTVDINGQQCLYLQDRDIDLVAEDYE